MSAQIDAYAALREKLSPSANIYVQNSKDFGTATLRWSQYKSPDFTVVVEVAIEDDVVEAVSLISISLFLDLSHTPIISNIKQ
jgi:hypothetical protein